MLDLNQNLTLEAATGVHAATLHNVRFDGLFVQKLSKYLMHAIHTAKIKLERLQFSTSSSFVKIRSACSCEFKTYF